MLLLGFLDSDLLVEIVKDVVMFLVLRGLCLFVVASTVVNGNGLLGFLLGLVLMFGLLHIRKATVRLQKVNLLPNKVVVLLFVQSALINIKIFLIFFQFFDLSFERISSLSLLLFEDEL